MDGRRLLRSLFKYFLWSALFAVAYTQSPLYTSNQNTYFLHGLACADIGYLRQDWLANTRDATPLFSALVCATLRYLKWEALFYLYYALLLGIYFYSLYWLAKQETDLTPRVRNLAFLALFFLVHSAGWRFVISRTLGAQWMYALEGGLANQRLLGTVFQPSVFGVLLLVAVVLALRQKTSASTIVLALATWFHPTYLLAATLLLLGILTPNLIELGFLHKERSTRQCLAKIFYPLLYYLLLISPAALNALSFSFPWEISPDIATKGRTILFSVRIPHHADPSAWFNLSSLFQIALMLSAPVLSRQKGLRWLLGIPILLAAVLTIAVVITRNTSLALIFPWRVSVVLVPISLTILLSRLVELLPSEKEYPNSAWLVWVFPSLSTSLIAVALLVGWVRISLDFQRQLLEVERPIMEYVAKNKQPSDIYLVPLKMEDFRLETGAPIYVDFKSTPYHPIELIEWQRRYQLANDFFQSPTCEKIASLPNEGITHMILPSAQKVSCSALEIQYSDETYQLIRLVSAP